MAAGVNRVLLIGVIGKRGIEVKYGTGGGATASFHLAVAETWADGTTHLAYFPTEVVGKHAERAAELAPGTAVVVDGRLVRRKRGETWETQIVCWDLPTISVPALAIEAAS